MNKLGKEEILSRARTHFFKAMLEGWPAGKKGTPVNGRPGFEEVVYNKEGFRVVDEYGVSSSGKSTGSTKIWLHGDPIWAMGYEGLYLKEDTLFLRRALLSAYSNSCFSGGRGPRSHAHGKMGDEGAKIYLNAVEEHGCFEVFRGREEIRDNVGERGYHRYWGMSLL